MSKSSVAKAPNVETALLMLQSLSSGDPEGFLAHIDEEFVYESPFYAATPEVRGRSGMNSMLAQLASLFTRVKFDVVDAFPGSDPQRVVLECRGDSVVASTGTPYRNHYVMLLRFRQGRVLSWREFSNPDAYRQALDR